MSEKARRRGFDAFFGVGGIKEKREGGIHHSLAIEKKRRLCG